MNIRKILLGIVVIFTFLQGDVLAEDGLVLHYSFDEGSGSIVYDRSGNENQGNIIGEPTWVETEIGTGLIHSEFQEVKPEVKGIPLKIGYCEGLGTQFFHGVINEVKLYNRALTEEEIFSHFESKAKGLEIKEDLKLSKRTALPGQKVLNNLVTELLNVKLHKAKDYEELKFTNSRNGWVFISTTAEIKEKGEIFVSIDSMSKEKPVIVHDKSGETLEAMRLLSSGEHKVKIWSEGNASFSLIVRAVPELIFRGFLGGPPVSGYEPLDYWEFLQKHVTKNINCMICGSGGFVNDRNIMSIVEGWKKQGKKWIHECEVPGRNAPGKKDITADEAYSYWFNQPGFQNPLLDGVIVDEFGPGIPNEKFEAYTKAVKMIHDNEKFREKTFYPYYSDPMYGNEFNKRFLDTIIEADYKIAWEKCFVEQVSENAAKKHIANIKQAMIAWQKAQSGRANHTIMVFGYLSLPIIVENLNVNPGVDYKVFMDMQFNLIANDPVFSGLYGVEEYSSAYADEETVRWASQLYRHYCIEGRTEMLSKKYGFKYMLDHIENPDFDNGTNGWIITPAKSGSIDTKDMKGLGRLQGRMRPTNQGNNFLWMKRSSKKPNVISQEIKNLTPGKLYSIKMITADYDDISEGISKKEKHAVSINIDNVELVPNKYFQEILGSRNDLGSFNNNHKAWMNYYWKVFRAKGTSAKLTISDWINDKESGGPIGQELMFNYIEVQPYLED